MTTNVQKMMILKHILTVDILLVKNLSFGVEEV